MPTHLAELSIESCTRLNDVEQVRKLVNAEKEKILSLWGQVILYAMVILFEQQCESVQVGAAVDPSVKTEISLV